MKKIKLVFIFLIVSAAAVLYAAPAKKTEQAKPAAAKSAAGTGYSLGLLVEGNMNTPDWYSLGGGLYFMGLLPDFTKVGRFSMGLKALYSYNFAGFHTGEAALQFRWSFYDFTGQVKKGAGFFFEAQGGALGAARSSTKIDWYWLAQGAFGYRYRFKNGLYIEPYVRAGYPVLWGAGLVFGASW